MKIKEEQENFAVPIKSWLAWGSLVFTLLVVFIQRQYVAIMAQYMGQRYGIDLSQISYLSTATLYGYAVMQIPTGILADKIGVRKLGILSWSITLLASFGMVFSQSFWMAWGMRFFIGGGTACAVTSLMKVQATYFPRRYFSQLSAAMALLGNLGNFISTVPLSLLMRRTGGPFVLLVITGLTFLCLLGILLFVHEKEDAKEYRAAFRVGNALQSVWSNPKTYPPLLIIFFFISTVTSLGGFWGIAYFREIYGMNEVQASWYMACLTVGFLIGSVVVSFMDRWTKGNNKFLIRVFTGGYAFCWVYLLVLRGGQPPLREMPFLMTAMGICIMFHLLVFTVVKNVNALAYSGVATASINMMEFIGSAVINTLVAALLSRGVPLERSMGILAVFACCAFVVSWFLQDAE